MTALIAKWGLDQLINNAVSITLGEDSIEFAKQPDGSQSAHRFRSPGPAGYTCSVGTN